MSPVDIAVGIAKDAQENLDGLDVVSIGPMWLGEADQIEVYAVVPKDGGKDFAANIVTLGTTESVFLAQINRQALIIAHHLGSALHQLGAREGGTERLLRAVGSMGSTATKKDSLPTRQSNRLLLTSTNNF
jgi:hypothetical protein